MDKLSDLLQRVRITAGVFYTGNLCGLASFDRSNQQEGHIHVLKRGKMQLSTQTKNRFDIPSPSLIFLPQPLAHKMTADGDEGADLVCATITYGMDASNMLTQGLPECMIAPFAEHPQLQAISDWLFQEAFKEHPGKNAVMNRLCELLVIELFRMQMETAPKATGVIVGLNHPNIGNVLEAIHQQPQERWSLEKMAELAHLSRSKFAALFKDVVGQPPGDYLTEWRLGLAQNLLMKGQQIGVVANKVGYEDGSALARAFRKKTGLSPKEWQHKHIQ